MAKPPATLSTETMARALVPDVLAHLRRTGAGPGGSQSALAVAAALSPAALEDLILATLIAARAAGFHSVAR